MRKRLNPEMSRRVHPHPIYGASSDPFNNCYRWKLDGKDEYVFVIVSNGTGWEDDPGKHWEHVSCSVRIGRDPRNTRIPTYEELMEVKDIFWHEKETVFQIHPPKMYHVNAEEVLHLWRPVDGKGMRVPDMLTMTGFDQDGNLITTKSQAEGARAFMLPVKP